MHTKKKVFAEILSVFSRNQVTAKKTKGLQLNLELYSAGI